MTDEHNPEELQIFQAFFRLQCSAILTLIDRLSENQSTKTLIANESIETLAKLIWNVFWAFSSRNLSPESLAEQEDIIRRTTHTFLDFLTNLQARSTDGYELETLNLMSKHFVLRKLFTNQDQTKLTSSSPPISRPARLTRIQNLTFLYVLRFLNALEDQDVLFNGPELDLDVIKDTMRDTMTNLLLETNHKSVNDIALQIGDHQAFEEVHDSGIDTSSSSGL